MIVEEMVINRGLSVPWSRTKSVRQQALNHYQSLVVLYDSVAYKRGSFDCGTVPTSDRLLSPSSGAPENIMLDSNQTIIQENLPPCEPLLVKP